MSFGPHLPDLYRRAAELVDKILRRAKPAEIPIEQPTKFELVIKRLPLLAGTWRTSSPR
jgi:putative ABC transport system substrate-binding protein